MNLVTLIDQFRRDIDDLAEPRLWSDEVVTRFADDAQDMFCRKTNGISDSSSIACEIDVELGEPFADLHPSILKIRRAMRKSDSREISVMNVEDMDRLGYRLDQRMGHVHAMIIGMDENKVRWGHVPQLTDTIMLSVFRRPLRRLRPPTADDVGCTRLEVAEQHHLHLLMWMKHLAYGQQDSDTYDMRKADMYEKKFLDYCAQAKAEQDLARHVKRPIAYGGL